MKKYALIIFFVATWLLPSIVVSQVSVFSCEAYPTITQTTVNQSGNTLARPCIELGTSPIAINNSTTKNFFASHQIHLKGDVHLGGFDSTGGVNLKITNVFNNDVDIALMNYDSLNGILKMEKLELGLKPDSVIQSKIQNFIESDPSLPFEGDTTKINPYVDWSIKVVAEFTRPGSGTVISIDGFYTKEFTSWQLAELPEPVDSEKGYYPNEYNSLGGWEEDTTKNDYPFRFRFVPDQVGAWKTRIKIYLGEQQTLAYTSPEFIFNVIDHSRDGYVSAGKHYLMQDGNTFFPIGCNLPWPVTTEARDPELFGKTGANETYVGNVRCMPRVYKKYRERMSLIKQNGGNLIRTIMYPNATEIEWEHQGNYTNRLNMAQEMDNILDYAEQLGLYIDWNMQIHYSLNTHDFSYGTNWSWNADAFDFAPSINDTSNRKLYRPYCYKTIVGNDPFDFYTNAEAKKYYKQRIRYILSRWGYSPNIAFFELISEITNTGCKLPECNPGDDENKRYNATTIPIYKNWQIEMAAYIKSFYYGKKHPLGSGYTSKLVDYQSGDVIDNTYENPNFDLICYTKYNYGFPTFAKGKLENITQSIVKLNTPNYHAIPKPVILSETDEAVAICDPDKVEMRRYLWQTMFTGVAGAFSWNMKDSVQLYPILGQMQNVLDKFNLDFEKDGWHPGVCTVGFDAHGNNRWIMMDSVSSNDKYNPAKYMDDIKEGEIKQADFIYLRSKDKKYGIGVMTNKTYNIYDYMSESCLGTSPFTDELSILKNIRINKKKGDLDLSYTYMSKGKRYYSSYYSVDDLIHLYDSSDNKAKQSFAKLKLKTIIDANDSRFISLVATHQKNESWMKQNVEAGYDEMPIQVISVSDTNNHEATDLEKLNDRVPIEKELHIYPNPFDEQLTIDNPFEEIEIELSTLEGKRIKSYKLYHGLQHIDTKSVPRGFYGVKIINEGRMIEYTKFLKL